MGSAETQVSYHTSKEQGWRNDTTHLLRLRVKLQQSRKCGSGKNKDRQANETEQGTEEQIHTDIGC